MGDNLKTVHRYNAACSAALAGSGQGKDVPSTDDAAGIRLREQARDWLRADLATWAKVVVAGDLEAIKAIVPTLDHWRGDADLADIRDEAALAKLPKRNGIRSARSGRTSRRFGSRPVLGSEAAGPLPRRCQSGSRRVNVLLIIRGEGLPLNFASADPTHDATPEILHDDPRLSIEAIGLAAGGGGPRDLGVDERTGRDTQGPGTTRTGKDAMGDWTTDAPGVRRKLTVADLPKPGDTPSSKNQPKVVKRPEGAWPKARRGSRSRNSPPS